MRNVSQKEIEEYLTLSGKDFDLLIKKADAVRNRFVGNKVYLRGVIEFTNQCTKNCYYCDIRKGNKNLKTRTSTRTEIRFAPINCTKVS